MPWETTEEYIRSGHRSPSEFKEGSLRTITLSEEEGIKAVIGKPKGQDTTEVQSYLFDKDKWTLEKAKAWFKEHQEERVREHVSALMPFRVLEKIVDKPLTIEGIALTVGMSRNFNIYTAEELQNFAQKLVSAPVYIEHVAVPNAVGKVTKTNWDGQTLFYEAEIYDEEIAAKIRKGLIQHVSVAADYEHIDVLDGKVPHGLHNAELSLVAVPGIPEANIQVMETLSAVRQSASPMSPSPIKEVNKMGKKVREAEWDTEYINNLPDSAFAVIAPGGEKDEQGKTVPRTLRKLPYKNAQGNIDLTHLRNALARLNQIEPASLIPAAKKKLCAAARSEKAEDLVSQFCGEEPTREQQGEEPTLELPTPEMTEELCNQLGGTWDPETNTCELPLAETRLKLRKMKEQEEPEKDEHGCIIGKEKWDEEQNKCVPIEQAAEQQGEIKPKEGEDYQTFIARCTESGKSMEQCALIWKEAYPQEEETPTEKAIKKFFEKQGVNIEKLLQLLKSKGLGEAIIDPTGKSFSPDEFVRNVKRLLPERVPMSWGGHYHGLWRNLRSMIREYESQSS